MVEGYTVGLFESRDSAAYNVLRACSWVVVSTFISYSLIIFALDVIACMVIFFAINLTSFVIMVNTAITYSRKIDRENARKRVKGLIIGLFVIILTDFAIVTFLLTSSYNGNFLYLTSDSAIGILFIIFEVGYYARYIFIGYSFLSITTMQRKMAGNYSYKDRNLITSYFIYPIIGTKIILFNSDAVIFNQFVLEQSIGTSYWPFMEMNLVMIIFHCILAAVYLAYIIESTIKFRIVALKMNEANRS